MLYRVAIILMVLTLSAILSSSRVKSASDMATIAHQAILMDMSTRMVLFEKNSTQRMATASMSKIMTLYLVFEALNSGYTL